MSSNEEETKEGYVYLLQDISTGLCKIGRTKNPNERISNIQVGNPTFYRLLNLIKCKNYFSGEKYLHLILKKYRKRGEWFLLPEEVQEWLKLFDKDPKEYITEELNESKNETSNI